MIVQLVYCLGAQQCAHSAALSPAQCTERATQASQTRKQKRLCVTSAYCILCSSYIGKCGATACALISEMHSAVYYTAHTRCVVKPKVCQAQQYMQHYTLNKVTAHTHTHTRPHTNCTLDAHTATLT
jgi:homoserine acetyltransferase